MGSEATSVFINGWIAFRRRDSSCDLLFSPCVACPADSFGTVLSTVACLEGSPPDGLAEATIRSCNRTINPAWSDLARAARSWRQRARAFSTLACASSRFTSILDTSVTVLTSAAWASASADSRYSRAASACARAASSSSRFGPMEVKVGLLLVCFIKHQICESQLRKTCSIRTCG